MIIVIYKENIIEKIISVRTEQEFLNSNILQENEEYKTFQSTKAHKGLDIRALNDDGTLKSVSEQVELGIIELTYKEILENEIIRKLTEIEKIEKGIIPMPENKEIRVGNEGNKYLYPLKDPTTKELREVETEIKMIENGVLKGIIQDRINGII